MPLEIRPLTQAERDEPANILLECFTFSVSLKRPLQTDIDNAVFNILNMAEISGVLYPADQHPFAGITIFCDGSHPRCAYAWSSNRYLLSPLDRPMMFMARVSTGNKQMLLDHLVDVCPNDTLSQALETAQRNARQQKAQEYAFELDIEEHRKSVPPGGVAMEEVSFVRRARALKDEYDDLHVESERCAGKLIFLEKVLIRRTVPPEERASDYRLGKMHDSLFPIAQT